MPFDVRDFPAADEPAGVQRQRRLVAVWLFTVCGMILVMVVLGGATRLTGSGLSIMEWEPLRGVLPPLSQHDWEKLFALYRKIPQYTLVNHGFGLAGFKQIFWLEWIHRLWGRLIGLAFLLPLLLLWARGAISRRLVPRLLVIFALGGLQGLVGWFMVASGFEADSTAVSPYRLVIHLSLALVLYVAILWTGLSVLRPVPQAIPGARAARNATGLACGLLALTILAGGLVAGTHAGLIDNTFPLMQGSLVPPDYARLHPLLRDLTQNLPAVQFDHRLLATLTAATVLATLALGLHARLPRGPRLAVAALGAAVLVQYGLGVATLLNAVPPALGIAHQGMAVLLLTAAVVALHALRGGRPWPARPPVPGRPAPVRLEQAGPG
ncbi:MAG TPA: COX15/CtaA family protein [Acetobacteraceae bacterium]|nr:COX15/CtaA family protein [Acetobacteraceae bacterium]